MTRIKNCSGSKGFTMIDNTLFRDTRLSLKAKGLHSLMLSLPNEWEFTEMGLTALCKEGRDTIRSAIQELEQYGYLVRVKTRDSKGHIGISEYELYDNPDNPMTENPMLENPTLENPTQLNTNNINKRNINIYISEFEEIWKLYPKKQGKDRAQKSYVKARKEGIESETIRQGVIAYADYVKKEKRESQYIKQGGTWFQGRCWQDEYKAGSGNKFLNLLNDL